MGDLAAWFQEQGYWDAGKEELERKGAVIANKPLNYFTLLSTQQERKPVRFHLAVTVS